VSNFIVFTLCSSLVDAVNTSAEPRIPEYDNAEITQPGCRYDRVVTLCNFTSRTVVGQRIGRIFRLNWLALL